MMRYLFLLFCFVIVGCAVKEVEYVTKIEYEYVTYDIPKNLTTSCIPTKPIDVDTYLTMSNEEKENYLTNFSIKLMGDVKKCDNKLKSVVRYINEMNKTHQQNNLKE